MYKLIIFAIVMLALSGICNGQGVSNFGASRAQDTSKTAGQLKLQAYGGSLDTMLLIMMPNGDVKKVAKNQFGSSYIFSTGLTLTGNVVTNNLSTGVNSANQVAYGSTQSAGTLQLKGTTHATEGKIILGDSSAYDDDNELLGIGTRDPQYAIHVKDGFSQIIQVETSSPTGISMVRVNNNNEVGGNLTAYGSGHSLTNNRNNLAINSDSAMRLVTNYSVSSGGPNPIIFSPGGYDHERARIDTGGNLRMVGRMTLYKNITPAGNLILLGNGTAFDTATLAAGYGLTKSSATFSVDVSALSTNFIKQGGDTRGVNDTIGTKDNFGIRWITNNAYRMGVTNAGRLLLGTDVDAGELLQVNGTARITNNSTASSVWASNGILTVTGSGEQAINVKSNGQSNFWRMGVGQGSNVSTNNAYLYFSDGTISSDFGFRLSGCCGGVANTLEAINVNTFSIRKSNSAASVISGAISGSQSGNSFQFQSNTVTTGGDHTVTSGGYNLFVLHVNTGTGAFAPTSGNAFMNSMFIQPTVNQTGTATGITRGIFVSPTLTAAADYRAYEATVTGTHYGMYITAARNYFSGNIGIGATPTGTDKVEVTGNLALMSAGNKIKIAIGSNASIGTATLVAGTVTVSTTAVTASSKIFLTVNTPGGIQGIISAPVASITAGTSFVINSTSATETSTINWWIIN